MKEEVEQEGITVKEGILEAEINRSGTNTESANRILVLLIINITINQEQILIETREEKSLKSGNHQLPLTIKMKFFQLA